MTLTAQADELVGLVRAWTAAQKAEHPRWPARTPGGLGGQFMETGEGLVKQIAGAFERVQTPQGRAQILSELNPEQLAGVAKAATAVQIPRGAPRDEIIRTLSSPVRGGRPAAPGAPAPQAGGSAAKVSAPDGWSEVDVAAQRKQAEEKLKAALDRSDAPDKEKLQRLGMRLIDDMYGSDAGRTFQRGNVTVTVAGGVEDIDQADLDLVTRRMEALQAAFPQAGPVSVTVMPRATMERLGGDRRAGIALPSSATGGQSVFMLHEGGFKHVPEAGEMPAHADEKLTEAEWTLVHEFGHLLERRSGESGDLHDAHSHGDHDHGLSEYGRTNPQEGYAEAFAEWWVSGGKTDNKAAKAYAERFGWAKPGEVAQGPLGDERLGGADLTEARQAGASLGRPEPDASIVDALAAVQDDPADPTAAQRQRWDLLRHLPTDDLRDVADQIGVRVPPPPEEGEFDQNALATFVAASYQKPKPPRKPRPQPTPEDRAAAVDALREKHGDWRENPDVLRGMNRDELRIAAADLGVLPGTAGNKVDALRAMLVKAAQHQKASGFRPGRWEQIDPGGIRAEALRQARAAVERAGRDVDEALLQQLADEIVAEGDQTFRNGHYTVSVHPNVYRAMVDPRQVQDAMERLVSQYPDAGPVSVRIVPESAMPAEHTHLGLRYTYGEVTPDVKKQLGTSAIVLSDRLFSHADEKPPHGHFMRASGRASRVEYVLAHEFGHVLEPPVMDNPRDVPGMSRYGREDMHEAFAEAFAEWHLSGGGGKRGGNSAARAFAERYGWVGAESEQQAPVGAAKTAAPPARKATGRREHQLSELDGLTTTQKRRKMRDWGWPKDRIDREAPLAPHTGRRVAASHRRTGEHGEEG